jgi:hypothetical protein
LENCKEFKQRVPSSNHDIHKNIELFFGEGQGEVVNQKVEMKFFIFPHPNPLPEYTLVFLTTHVAGRGDSFICFFFILFNISSKNPPFGRRDFM